MFRLGITGGIGSGKSYICGLLEARGWPVYYADPRAKAVMQEDQELRANLRNALGPQVFLDSGELNRPWLSQQAFANPQVLKTLNGLVHPAVLADYQRWQEQQAAAGHRRLAKEAAILLEAGTYQDLDALLLVTAPLPLRLQRLQQRENWRAAEAMARVGKQWTDQQKRLRADAVIWNDGLTPTAPQLDEFLESLSQAGA